MSFREADVEHLVGFVEDNDPDLVHPQRAAPQVVEDAPGRPDDDVHARSSAVNCPRIRVPP